MVKVNSADNILEYKGYFGSVEFSPEDDCLFGQLLGLQRTCILYEGQTLDELKIEFEQAVEGYLEDCAMEHKEPQKPFSGMLHVKISPELQLKTVLQARKKGESLDAFVKHAIEEVL